MWGSFKNLFLSQFRYIIYHKQFLTSLKLISKNLTWTFGRLAEKLIISFDNSLSKSIFFFDIKYFLVWKYF